MLFAERPINYTQQSIWRSAKLLDPVVHMKEKKNFSRIQLYDCFLKRVSEKDVEQLLVSLILDNRIQGHIDQVKKLLERGERSKGMRKYNAIDKWNSQLKSIYQTLSNRVG